MHIPKLMVVFILLSAIMTGTASASNAVTSYFYDVGCGEIVKVMDTESKKGAQTKAFIVGFVTGVNYTSGRTTNVKFNGLELWVKNYCADNPLKNFADALFALDQELDKPEYR